MTGIAVNEGNRPLNSQRHRLANISMIPRVAVRFGAAISVGQYPAVGKHGGGIAGKQNDTCGGGIMPGRVRIAPDESAREETAKQVLLVSWVRLFGARDQPSGGFVVEVFPAETFERLTLEIGRGFDRLFGNFVFVRSRLNGETLLQYLQQRGANFLEQLEQIAEAFVLQPVFGDFPDEVGCSLLARERRVTFDESQNRKHLVSSQTILLPDYGDAANGVAVFLPDESQTNVAVAKESEAFFGGPLVDGRVKHVKYRFPMALWE